MKINGTC